ncbi:MAG: ABC transporter substrate-binding protein [Hyphomicrobiales bacterium]|nr:ABC transporter substrate-binding protein [Hyphomicrobiales bacterium]
MLRRVLLKALAVSLLSSVAPVSAMAETTTLTVMYANPAHKRFHEPLAEAFMKTHPDIKIEFLAPAETYPDGHQKILRGVVTGNVPDVWNSGYTYLSELARKLSANGQITNLTEMLKSEGDAWVSDNYAPSILKLAQVDGIQWGMPLTSSTPIVYYNKDLFKSVGVDPDQFPKTWDEVIAVSRKISDTGGADGISYAANEWGDDWLWQALIRNFGGTILDDAEANVTFGDKAGLSAVSLLRRLVTEAKMPNLNEDQAIQQFSAGKLGIVVASTAEVRGMADAIGGKFKLGTAPFPAADGENGGLPTGGMAATILTQDPVKQKAAWEWLKFETGPEGQKIVVMNSGYMPTNLHALDPQYLGDFYQKNPDWMTSVKQVPIAKPWVAYPGGANAKVWDSQKAILTAIMRGETKPEEGLAEMVDATTKLIKTN